MGISQGDESVAPRLKYTEAAFLAKSREYIASIRYTRPLCDSSGREIRNELGEQICECVYALPPNTADWAVYLGMSKSTLTHAYRLRYPDAYEQIKTELEAYNVRELLSRKSGTDVIKFNLQVNFGWRDARQTEDGAQAEAASQPPLSLAEKLQRIDEMLGEIREDE